MQTTVSPPEVERLPGSPPGGPLLLNLGCGKDKRGNWVNVDNVAEYQPDVLHDLNRALPFKGRTFHGVYASHVLEHVRNWYQLLEEMFRVLRPGGRLDIRVPDFDWAIRQYLTGDSEGLFYGCDVSGLRRDMDWEACIYGGLKDRLNGNPHVMAFSCLTGRKNDLARMLSDIGFLFITPSSEKLPFEIRLQATRLA